MKKILSIIIIGILIGCSFGVQGMLLKQTVSESSKITTIDFNDFLFDKKMELLMKLSKFPSLSACVIEGDEVTWSNAYGYYDLATMKPATENTIYNIASITKTITGTALMQLWEQRLFDLDEDVNNYLPFSLRNPHFPESPITFRMLLSHSSSLNSDPLEYYWFNFSSDPPFNFYPYPWLEDYLVPGSKWYNTEIWSNMYRPGEYNMYANVGFELIGYLIELISGEEFMIYCKNHIFIPLEMHMTWWNLSEFNIENVAIPYHYHDGEYIHINDLNYILGSFTPPDKYWRSRMYPAGDLYTTVSDLSHFFIAHMNSGVWNSVRILKEDTIEEMHKIQPPAIIDPLNYYFALGWLYQDFPFLLNITFSGHTGDVWGAGTMMFSIPGDNVGIIFFTNGDTLYDGNYAVSSLASILIILNFFKKGGVNIISYIDF